MKKETAKKSKLWLWLLIGAVVLAAVGTALALILGGGVDKAAGPVGGRPELYWNVDRLVYTENSESGLSTREPDADGLYRIRFSKDGEMVEYTAADKQLVNYIDSQPVMGLSVDSSGQILDALEPKEVCTVIGARSYLQEVVDGGIVANSSLAMNGLRQEIRFTELTEIYEVSGLVEPIGQKVDSAAFLPLDTIGIFANDKDEVTHVYIMEHTEESKIYWRAEQFYDSSLKQTTRVPDEHGIYSMEFYCEGELVTLKTRDRDIVNHVDSRDRYACAKGFAFDEEGFVVGEIDPALGTRTVLGCERFDVTAMEDGTVMTEKLWNPDGAVFSFPVAADCVIYDVSATAEAEGRRGKPVESLQLGDRVSVWCNPKGEAVIIYVACRTVEVDIFYFPERKFDATTNETTRKPNADGWYEIELLKVGESQNRIFRTKDKAMVDYIDKQNARTLGLKVDGDVILQAYGSESIFGYTPITRGGAVPNVSGGIFSRMTYGKPEGVRNSVMAADCKIINVSPIGTYGAETTLQPYDRIYAHRKPTGEAIFIFVTQRRGGLEHLYWNTVRMYDNTAKTTTRTPNEDGWYVFDMIWQGKAVTLKTRSKSIANQIDQQASCALGMDVSGDVIVKVYGAENTSGGSSTMSGYRVKEVRSDGTVVVYINSGDNYRERTFRMKSDCVIYNVSDAYYNRKGETVSALKTGDMVLVVTDINAEAEVVFIRYREADNMYWKTDRFYDTENAVTSRKPDAEGWYHFDLAVNGTVKRFKTKDQAVATKLDATISAFGLVVDGDVIRSYVPTNWVRGVGFTGVTNWEVTAVSGNRVTVKYQLPGSSETGKTQTITLASGAKIYDVSPSAASFGEASSLQVGDQIRTYQNESNTAHLYVYIQHRATRPGGLDGYCDHCGKTVHWNPYSGGSITRTDGHYYLSGDCRTASQLGVGLENKDYEIVLDLCGRKLTRVEGGRFALVRYGDTLTILDSVGGGSIYCEGAEGWNGGAMYVTGGHVNLLGGTLETAKTYDHKWGGVLYLSESTFTMSGGTLIGGSAQRGGAIYNTGSSVIRMSGGTITGGHASKESGGNIYLMSDTALYVTGGEITNGTSVGRGGNIHVDSAVLQLKDATVSGGTSERSDDGICVNSSKSSLEFENLTCKDKILIRYMGKLTLSGCVKIGLLEIPAGKTFTVGTMAEGSEVYVNTQGIFTEAFENAQAYADYFKSAVEGTEVFAQDNVLTVAGERVYCPHCDQKVVWSLWKADTTIEGPTAAGEADHYFIDGDFTNHTAQRTVKGNVVLDLRGHSYITSGIRNFLVTGDLSVLDSVGGGVMMADGSGDDGSIAYLNGAAATFRLYSGTLKTGENLNVKNGGLLAANRGTILILGGSLEGGNVTGKGSAIWNKRHVALTVENATVDGSVYIIGDDESHAALTLNNATVTDAITVGDKTDVTVSGKTVLANLDLTGGKKITLGELTEGTAITVTAEGVFTEPCEMAETYSNWFASSDGQQILVAGDALRVGPEEVIPEPVACPHCGSTDVSWQPWPGTTKPASGHYYIDSDFTAQTGQWTISSGTDVVLDLQGHSYTTAGIRNFLVSGTFSVMDTVGGGVMSADGSGDDGTIAYINGAAAHFKLYGGMLRQGQNPNVKNGGLLAANRGSISILGGSLVGGNVTGNGSAIWNKRHVALTVENATIDGSVYIIGDDESNATLTLNNATVTDAITVGNKTDVTVSGKLLLANLNLSGGKKITLGELTEGTAITVTAEGVFTNSSPDAGTYFEAGYFACTGEGMQVQLQTDVLAVASQTPGEPEKTVFEKAARMTAEGVFAAGGTVRATCPVCEAEADWEPLQPVSSRTMITGQHHYYLAEDLNENTYYYYFGDAATTAQDAKICLHLNGHSIRNTVADTNDNARAFYVENDAVLNIMGEGTVAGACKQIKRGALDVRGVLNLYGGNYESTSAKYPVIQIRYATAVVNVHPGTVIGTEAMDAIGVYVQQGSLNILGGTLWGKTQALAATAVSAEGAPKVQLLELASEVLLELKTLEENTDITVSAEGVFTKVNANALSYKENGWIKAAQGKQITEEAGVLSMSALTLRLYLKSLFA